MPIDLISIIIPTYNERENVREIARRIAMVLTSRDYEIIFVDDDSPDGTWKVIEEMEAEDQRVRLYHRIGRKGLSSAVVDGCGVAKGQTLVVMDADLQHDETIIPSMVERLRDFEVVVGTRHADGGSTGTFTWYRRFMSHMATMAVRWLLGVSVSDPMSGFFALRHSLFDRISSELQPRGFKILLEVLWRGRVQEIAEVGYTFRNRIAGESKLDSTVILDFLVSLASMRFGSLFSPRFVRYGLVGASGAMVQLAVTGLLNSVAASQAIAAGIGSAIVWNFVLNDLWTFADARKGGMRLFIRRFLQFFLVCGAGAIINHAVALDVLTVFDNRLVASLIGICFATFWNYNLNRKYTWASNE
jgi:dolichol-phosphate mannosyltransferase